MINLPRRHDAFTSFVGPTSNKHRKARTKREKDNPTTVTPSETRIFEWTMKHQEAFDALKKLSVLLQYWAIPISPGNSY